MLHRFHPVTLVCEFCGEKRTPYILKECAGVKGAWPFPKTPPAVAPNVPSRPPKPAPVPEAQDESPDEPDAVWDAHKKFFRGY